MASGKDRLVGDMLTLGGSFLTGLSHVGMEHSLIAHNQYEFLGFVGLFGSVISASQISLLERENLLYGIRWELWDVGVLLAAYTVAQFAFYSSLPHLIKLSSAAGLHLSLLTTDFYSIMAGMIFFKYQVRLRDSLTLKCCVTPLFLLQLREWHIGSLVLVLFGSLLFHYAPVPIVTSRKR